jgi:NitT/TauT family transport system permease protein
MNRSRLFSQGKIDRWLSLIAVVVGLAAWEAASRTKVINPLFYPPPSLIIQTLFRMIGDGDLALNLGATLGRVGAGLLSGGSAGLAAGLLLGWSPRLRRIFDPVVSFLYPLPKLALFPLCLIIFGLGDTSRVVLIALAAFFPLLINTLAGVQQINPDYFEIARSYGASPLIEFQRVILPGSLPSMLSGLRLAVGNALVTAIAVELMNAQVGLGAVIWLAWETLRTSELYVALLMTALVGIASHLLLEFLSRRLVAWQIERSAEVPANLIPEI